MLNSLTLRKSAKQTGFNLKQRLDGYHYSSALPENSVSINALNSIIEVDETFFLNLLKGSVLFNIER
ncbi:MAG: hypothetical protein ACTS7E_02245 [Arsenophonus sp. NC-CH8-MAG3]